MKHFPDFLRRLAPIDTDSKPRELTVPPIDSHLVHRYDLVW